MTRRVRVVCRLLPLCCMLTTAHAQVAAGGGGTPRADQYFAPDARFTQAAFVAAGKDLSRSQAEERDAAWRAEIRKQFFMPDALPSLNAKVWSTFSPTAGVLADRVTYATADGMRVTAIVYRPDPKTAHWHGKLPGIVIVNGHGGDKSSWYAFYSGMLFAKAGAIAVTYDPIGEMERSSDRTLRKSPAEHDHIVDTPHWGQRLAGLMQTDAMQAVTYLRSMREVDTTRIGMVAYSMGAFVGGITGALDTRIHALLLSGGGTFDGPQEYYDTGTLPCQAPPWRALGVLGDRSAVLYALNADRGPTFIMNGDADTVMKMGDHPPAWFAAVRERAAHLHGKVDGLFTTVLYPGVSHRPNWLNVDGMLWLNDQLHFALWNDETIRTAGATHIAEWAKKNSVAIGQQSLEEDREGGVRAVGQNIPALTREDLTVLPEAEWKRQLSQLTYAAWAQRTLAAEQDQTRLR